MQPVQKPDEVAAREAFARAVRRRERLENALREAYKREWAAGAAWQAIADRKDDTPCDR